MEGFFSFPFFHEGRCCSSRMDVPLASSHAVYGRVSPAVGGGVRENATGKMTTNNLSQTLEETQPPDYGRSGVKIKAALPAVINVTACVTRS